MRPTRWLVVVAVIGLSACSEPQHGGGGVTSVGSRAPDYTPSPAQAAATTALRQAIGPGTEIHMILPGTAPEVVCGYAGRPPPHTPADRLSEVSFVYDGQRLTTSRDPAFGHEQQRVCPTLAVAP